jgi:hypothetical protein
MGGLGVGDAWLPARPDGSLWLGGGIVKPGPACLPRVGPQVADERAAWPGWSLAGSPRPNRAGPGGYLARLWGGDGWVLRRQPGRTTLRPRSVSLFQESPGCPPGSGGPVAGPPAGTRPATAPASREPFAGVRDAQAARESRM